MIGPHGRNSRERHKKQAGALRGRKSAESLKRQSVHMASRVLGTFTCLRSHSCSHVLEIAVHMIDHMGQLIGQGDNSVYHMSVMLSAPWRLDRDF